MHTSRLFMRQVTAVPADELARLQRSWTYVHPLVLSGREAPLSTPAPVTPAIELQEVAETEPNGHRPTQKVSSAALDAARERFLKRKRPS